MRKKHTIDQNGPLWFSHMVSDVSYRIRPRSKKRVVIDNITLFSLGFPPP